MYVNKTFSMHQLSANVIAISSGVNVFVPNKIGKAYLR
jgi:hypothetical protein